MYAKLRDAKGEIEVSNLTTNGLHEALHQCKRLVEEINDRIEVLMSEDNQDLPRKIKIITAD